jgi:hypothetical protein
MDPGPRARFNAAFDDGLYRRYVADLTAQVDCEVGFRLAETPVFLPADLRERCVQAGAEIVAQLCDPERIAMMRSAIPARWNAPGETALPSMAVLDFAIARDAGGTLVPRLVELQGFPSLLAFEVMQRDAWDAVLGGISGLEGPWSSWFAGLDRSTFLELARRTIVGDHDPANVVLLDLDPSNQKTYADFRATSKLFGVDAVCPTALRKRGRRLYRSGSDGSEIAVERIYYRLVIDELEKKQIALPFDLRDDLDVEWSPHPNWFWIWSKFSLPFLKHPAVPRTRFVADLDGLPQDLTERYVLKPLFSFAGGGVNIHPSRADVAAIPAGQRANWCLQEKISYSDVLQVAGGGAVKVELRMMYLRPDGQALPTAATNLCRLSRGEMLGVDFNRNLTWVGSSIGLWRS